MNSRWRLVIACAATLLILTPLAWMWWNSLVPGEYSVMDMGYPDYGGGPQPSDGSTGHGTHSDPTTAISIDDLGVDPKLQADVHYDLVARQGKFTLASGRTVDGYTINGKSPGPTIHATLGDLVEVTVTNESVADGITLHWHGIDVPNPMDGVAGVTQDAVMEGESFTYRFFANHIGTYWYHSHQVSHEQVIGGLFGGVVIQPDKKHAETQRHEDIDTLAMVHIYGAVRTVNGLEGDVAVDAQEGQTVRVRVVNTDNGPMSVWTSGRRSRRCSRRLRGECAGPGGWSSPHGDGRWTCGSRS